MRLLQEHGYDAPAGWIGYARDGYATPAMSISRRDAAIGLLTFVAAPRLALSTTLSTISVTKDPNCGCCSGWVTYLREHGFTVDVTDTPEINRVKGRLGIPKDLWACHTGQIAGYVIEGHVPAPTINRLLREKPNAKGLSVPGMPAGSPGMEIEGSPAEEYKVILFGPAGQQTFARFRGVEELPSS